MGLVGRANTCVKRLVVLKSHESGALTSSPVVSIPLLSSFLSVAATVGAVTAQVELDHGPILVLWDGQVLGLILPNHGSGFAEVR